MIHVVALFPVAKFLPSHHYDLPFVSLPQQIFRINKHAETFPSCLYRAITMALTHGAPPEALRSNDEISDEDKFVKSMHSVLSQYNKSQGLPKPKYPKTVKHINPDEKRKTWRKMRNQLSGMAVDKM